VQSDRADRGARTLRDRQAVHARYARRAFSSWCCFFWRGRAMSGCSARCQLALTLSQRRGPGDLPGRHSWARRRLRSTLRRLDSAPLPSCRRRSSPRGRGRHHTGRLGC